MVNRRLNNLLIPMLRDAAYMMAVHNDMRAGQAFVNALSTINHELSRDVVRKAENDCFYDDSKIPNFFQSLLAELTKETNTAL